MEAKFVKVIDTSATADCPLRNHDIRIGDEIQTITFQQGAPTRLPFEIGMKFMKDGFIVLDDDGEGVVPAPATTDETIRLRIGADEVVAKYEELTVSALMIRAAALPGGEKLTVGAVDRVALIDFLKGTTSLTSADEVILADEVENEDEIQLEIEDAPEDDTFLLGSNIQPSTFITKDGVVQLGAIVQAAFLDSGLPTARAWNAFVQTKPEEAEAAIQAQVDKLEMHPALPPEAKMDEDLGDIDIGDEELETQGVDPAAPGGDLTVQTGLDDGPELPTEEEKAATAAAEVARIAAEQAEKEAAEAKAAKAVEAQAKKEAKAAQNKAQAASAKKKK
jgi:hypothetical protein